MKKEVIKKDFSFKECKKNLKELGNWELYELEKAVNTEFVKRGFTDRLKLRELLKNE